MSNYPSNPSDSQWQVIKEHLNTGRKRKHDLREIANGVIYLVKSGCQWRYLPKDLPSWEIVYYYFNSWKHGGIFEKLQLAITKKVREMEGRESEPTVGIMDSQSIKATLVSTGKNTGFDAGKKIKGVKRHIVVDSLGLLLCVVVHSAAIQDRDGAEIVLKKLQHYWHKIVKVFADGGYQGKLIETVQKLFGYILEIVKRDEPHVFKVLPKRWLVERTFSWIDTHRRTAKSYERLSSTAEAITQIAALKIMLKRF